MADEPATIPTDKPEETASATSAATEEVKAEEAKAETQVEEVKAESKAAEIIKSEDDSLVVEATVQQKEEVTKKEEVKLVETVTSVTTTTVSESGAVVAQDVNVQQQENVLASEVVKIEQEADKVTEAAVEVKVTDKTDKKPDDEASSTPQESTTKADAAQTKASDVSVPSEGEPPAVPSKGADDAKDATAAKDLPEPPAKAEALTDEPKETEPSADVKPEPSADVKTEEANGESKKPKPEKRKSLLAGLTKKLKGAFGGGSSK